MSLAAQLLVRPPPDPLSPPGTSHGGRTPCDLRPLGSAGPRRSPSPGGRWRQPYDRPPIRGACNHLTAAAEHKAHLHRPHRMSGASQNSGRCQVQRRVRLAHVRGSEVARSASRLRGSPPTVAAERSTTDPPAVSRPTGGRHQPHLAATSRANHQRAPRGAPPTRTTVSPRAAGHAQPHLAAASRANHQQATRGARHPGFTHADHTPTTAARALLHAMVAEHKAHLHRHDTVSGASRIRWRCQVQRRVRLAANPRRRVGG
ncbi:hypothetical protein GobsT_43960 [Gemmata obscuriglobus]|nr:hypothetical protein GobsT_43960 [Gemmata obscuriglobus]VTS08877.1 unnamed protein product [Gemmata obscuriglobus UQM 2246]